MFKVLAPVVQKLNSAVHRSLRASSPIWASKTSLARTREGAAKPRGTPRSRVLARLASLAHSFTRSREALFACPNRRACSQAISTG